MPLVHFVYLFVFLTFISIWALPLIPHYSWGFPVPPQVSDVIWGFKLKQLIYCKHEG